MAKVANKKTGKAQGASPANSKSNSDVIATRNGQQRTFKRLLWDELPPSKEGWSEVKESPKEPELKTSDVDKTKAGATGSGKKEQVDNKKSGDDASKEEKKDENSSTGKTTKVLTQDDLDLNPELAEQGFKVGDTVEFEEEDPDGED